MCRQSVDGEPVQTDFLIREFDEYFKKIPPNPEIRIRAGLWQEGKISLVCVLLLVDRNFDLPYETW